MISEKARASFERVFIHALSTRLAAREARACAVEVEPLPATCAAAQGDLIVLTVSSMAFRLLVVLQFGDDDATREHYAVPGEAHALDEALLEIGNLCCGALNQQLAVHFPDLGMSTPYRLDRACLTHLEQLRPAQIVSCHATIDTSVGVGATLCVCPRASVDFDVQVAEMTVESDGELELF